MSLARRPNGGGSLVNFWGRLTRIGGLPFDTNDHLFGISQEDWRLLVVDRAGWEPRSHRRIIDRMVLHDARRSWRADPLGGYEGGITFIPRRDDLRFSCSPELLARLGDPGRFHDQTERKVPF